MRDTKLPPHHPERTCLGCRTQHEAHDLLRFVCMPDGMVRLDFSGHAPGRGVYSCCDRRCVQRMLRVANFTAIFKRSVLVPNFDTVYQDIVTLLERRVRTCLSLGQKAHVLVSGYALLQRALAQGRVSYVILAEDIAPERAAEYRTQCLQQQVPYVTRFTKEEICRILGKSAGRSAVGFVESPLLALLGASLTSLEKVQTASQTV